MYNVDSLLNFKSDILFLSLISCPSLITSSIYAVKYDRKGIIYGRGGPIAYPGRSPTQSPHYFLLGIYIKDSVWILLHIGTEPP